MSKEKLSKGEKKVIKAGLLDIKGAVRATGLSYGYCRKVLSHGYIRDAIKELGDAAESEPPGDNRIGNQFWKLANPDDIGRPRIFDKPRDLWEEVVVYFQECDSNPLIKTEKTTTGGKIVSEKEFSFKVPYTWEGLYVSLGVCNLKHYKKNDEFSPILEHIGNVIRNQKFSGAAVGIFSATIISRDLGLKDKKELSGGLSVVSMDDKDKNA